MAVCFLSPRLHLHEATVKRLSKELRRAYDGLCSAPGVREGIIHLLAATDGRGRNRCSPIWKVLIVKLLRKVKLIRLNG